MHYSLKPILIILSIFWLKILFASFLPFLNDEAYAVAVSKNYSISFFDHPPIGFWSSQIFAETLGINNKFFYRLPFLFYGFITTIIIFELGKQIKNATTGIWTALIYNFAPFYFFSGGLFIVPDGPLNLGIALVALLIVKLHQVPHRYDNNYLLFLGFALAWCFACKYQGYLIGLGCLLVLVFSPRRSSISKNPLFYICILISTFGFLPTLIWNYQNEWVSFQFHQSRQNFEINIINLVTMLIASMFYLIPQNVIIPIQTLINKNYREKLNYHEKNLILISLPNILLFLIVFSTSDRSFPHWIMPGWLLLLPLVANHLINPIMRLSRIIYFVSILCIWSFLGIFIIHSQTGFLTNHREIIPKWDNTLELISWDILYSDIEEIIKSNTNKKEPKIAALTWTEAGKFSSLMKNKYTTLVLDSDPHHFAYMQNKLSIKSPTYLIKISLGKNPEINSILDRIKKYDKNAYHIKDLNLPRGSQNYATASIFYLDQ